HLFTQLFALRLLLQVRLAGAGLRPLLLPAEQDRRLVAVRGLPVAAGATAFECFPLLAQQLLALPAFVAALLQGTCRQRLFLRTAGSMEFVVATVAAQAKRGQFDDALHVTKQFAVMADHQQAVRPAPQLLAQQPPTLCV